MRTGTNWRSKTWRILATALLLVVAACDSPLDIDTPRRFTRVNIDSLVSTDSFIGAPGDSIFAYVDDHQVVFATEVVRPVFYNRLLDGRYYVAVQATRYGLNGRDYEVMSLRLDGIRDTGTYDVNSSFSVPKQIDTESPPSYGALYERRVNAGFPESYRTGGPNSTGTIRVIRIDEDRGVMVGTFVFKGYFAEHDSLVTIDRGAFRLYLKK
jgi:hypothetical protein